MSDHVSGMQSIMTSCKSHYSREIEGLYLYQELLGNSHNFNLSGFKIVVRIPFPAETRKIRTAGSHVVDGENIPFLSQIKIIDIYIDIPNDLECINSEDTNNVNPDHKITGCDPNNLIREMTEVSIKAFRYWLDIVRLMTKDYHIGLGSRKLSSNSSAYIVDSIHEKPICSGPIGFISKIVDHGINNDMWDKIQSELNKGFLLPIHYQFLIDASHALEDWRLKSCIIDLAMACETYLRYSVFEVLGECPEDVKSNMELANINSFANGYFKIRVVSSHLIKYEKLRKSHLNSLFDARNKLVHMGETERVTHKNCVRFIKKANELFDIQLKDTSGNLK